MTPVNIGMIITSFLAHFLFDGWALLCVLVSLLIIWIMAFITWAFDNAEEVDDFGRRFQTEL